MNLNPTLIKKQPASSKIVILLLSIKSYLILLSILWKTKSEQPLLIDCLPGQSYPILFSGKGISLRVFRTLVF